MWVKSNIEPVLTNTDRFSKIEIIAVTSGYEINGIVSDIADDEDWHVIGKYSTKEQAEEVLDDMAISLRENWTLFSMPKNKKVNEYGQTRTD